MEKVIHILYSGLGGHASVVFALKEADVEADYSHMAVFYGNLPLVPFYADRCDKLGLPYHYIKKIRGFSILANRKLLQTLIQEAPDVVIVHIPQTITVVSAFKRLKPATKIIAVEHHPNILKRPSDWQLSEKMMVLANNVVFLTDIYSEQVRKRIGANYNSNKAAVIANGVNTESYRPDNDTRGAPPRERILKLLALHQTTHSDFNADEFNFVIGMCTRLSTQKDIDTLLHALHSLGNTASDIRPVLMLAGDGPHRSALENLAAELNIVRRVVFLGMLEEHLLCSFYNNLDLYVHASQAETMSTSVMQAMSTGLPVIASDIAGMNVLINPARECGKLVKPKDSDALCRLIVELAEHKETRTLLGKNARQHTCENLSNTNSWRQYLKLIR